MFDEEFRSRRERKWVDLTPLVDLTYILFIFFIVTTTFAKTGIALSPPLAKHVTQAKSVSINIYIDREGLFYHDKDPLSKVQLAQLIQNMIRENKDTLFVINPDKETKTQNLLDVIDICKDAGAANFSIASLRRV